MDDVVIWVAGTSFRNNSFSGNVATFNITHLNLKAGLYTVTATVNDTEFDHKNFTALFTVNKTSLPMNITVFNNESIYVGDTVKIVVSVPKDVTENVTLEINNIKLTNVTVNGNATFYVPSITYGNKTVVAAYIGDDRYYYNSTTANFTVNKRDSQVNVTATGNSVGGNATIVVQVQTNATGYVTVNVNGTSYTIALNSTGAGSINITGLGNGTYYVYATYLGDDQYLTSENNTETFEMTKVDTSMVITVDSIDYGGVAKITVTITNDATGYITIRINETKSITLPIDNGKVQWNVSGLAADNYTVYANYSGDGKYNINNTDKVNKSFEVRQISPNVEVINVISEAGKKATVVVRIDARTTENITVTVNNKDYSIKPDVDGFAVVVSDVLENGTYTAVASYAGDKNFTAHSDSFTFTTNKTSDYVMNITAVDIEVGDKINVTVNVPTDAKCIVKLEINDVNYTATINNGKAVFNNLINLAEGRYNITAYFGNDKYENKTATGTFYVNKHITPISINVDNIKVGDKAVITVTVLKDVANNVTIEIDGVKYNKTVDATTGKAVFEVQLLSNGTRTVVATYAGDDKYVFNSTTKDFTVSKRISQVNVTATGNSVGDNATISVEIPANATGYVIVNVNGTNYTINTTGGVGSVKIAGLGNGTYYVHATYIGDDQYLPSVNNTETFEMVKVVPVINIAVDNVTYGTESVIVVT